MTEKHVHGALHVLRCVQADSIEGRLYGHYVEIRKFCHSVIPTISFDIYVCALTLCPTYNCFFQHDTSHVHEGSLHARALSPFLVLKDTRTSHILSFPPIMTDPLPVHPVAPRDPVSPLVPNILALAQTSPPTAMPMHTQLGSHFDAW
jgi:hypothetical protein